MLMAVASWFRTARSDCDCTVLVLTLASCQRTCEMVIWNTMTWQILKFYSNVLSIVNFHNFCRMLASKSCKAQLLAQVSVQIYAEKSLVRFIF